MWRNGRTRLMRLSLELVMVVRDALAAVVVVPNALRPVVVVMPTGLVFQSEGCLQRSEELERAGVVLH